MVTFDHGPLLQGEVRTAKLKSAYNFSNLLPLCLLLFLLQAMFGDTLPARNKASGIILVLICDML